MLGIILCEILHFIKVLFTIIDYLHLQLKKTRPKLLLNEDHFAFYIVSLHPSIDGS